MPTYIVVSQSASGLDIRPITAASRDAAAQAIKAALAQGMAVNAGQREPIQIGLIDLAAFGTITPNATAANATISYTNQAQVAIADLAAAANAATIVTKVNALLAALRAAGIIAP